MSDDKKVYSLNSGKKATKESLIELANDPNMENFMVVVFWENGTCSTGWSSGTTNGELTYGLCKLQKDMFEALT